MSIEKTNNQTVWVVDDDQSITWVLERAFSQAGYKVRVFDEATAVLTALAEQKPQVIFTDIRMPGMTGLELLARLQKLQLEVPVIVMTAFSDLDSAVSAYKQGAFEYLPKPFDIDEALALLERAVGASREMEDKHNELPADGQTQTAIGLAGMVGQAPAMQAVFQTIGRLSRSDISVLIRGESGTGKELVARALHDSSPREKQPFVEINTAAIPAELLESELFGHEKGAFTGADELRKGRFEQANGGTLFLDEIGDMPAELQTRLLRVLSEKRFFRIGGRDQITVDVRVVAATNQDLETLVEDGRFRLDLFHRLNVVEIKIPPLRERGQDIPILVQHFLQQAAKEFSLDAKQVDEPAMGFMQAFEWPGNVRELQNQCRRLTVIAPGKSISVNDLPAELVQINGKQSKTSNWQSALRQHVRSRLLKGEQGVLDRLQPQIEKELIDVALAFSGGHKHNAARLLGWGRNTLTRKMQELDLQ